MKPQSQSDSPPAQAIITWNEFQKHRAEVAELRRQLEELCGDFKELKKNVDQLMGAKDAV